MVVIGGSGDEVVDNGGADERTTSELVVVVEVVVVVDVSGIVVGISDTKLLEIPCRKKYRWLVGVQSLDSQQRGTMDAVLTADVPERGESMRDKGSWELERQDGRETRMIPCLTSIHHNSQFTITDTSC